MIEYIKLWHYCPATYLPEIIKSQYIKLSRENHYYPNAKCVAWLSSNPLWENGATKTIKQNGESRVCKMNDLKSILGLGRIEVAHTDQIYPWKHYRQTTAISPKILNTWEDRGKGWGAVPKEWYVSYSPIDSNRWLDIEVMLEGDDVWKPFDPSVALPDTKVIRQAYDGSY